MTSNQIAYFKAKTDEAHYERVDLENARHNYAVEKLQQEQNEEVRRADLAREAETHRANVAQETNYFNNLQESIRHNQVTEAQNWQSIGQIGTRYQYQNLLDSASTTLRQEETELTGSRIVGQNVSNKQAVLNYNLDAVYAEPERVLDAGKTGNVFVDSILGIGRVGAKIFGYSGSNNQRYSQPIVQSAKPYFSLNK